MPWNIVIAGGGFGGFYAARQLEKQLAPGSAHVTLVSETNFMLYTPLLPGAASGTLDPRHVVVPLREELHSTSVRIAAVTGLDPGAKTLRIDDGVGGEAELPYDHLILTMGSVSKTLPVPGLSEHAVGFKTLPDAIALRNRLLRGFDIAEATEDDDDRAAWLTWVFVGAGYAGLEGLAELQDLAADLLHLYPRCSTTGARFVLVEAQERVMPEISASLAEFATRELRGRGIEVRTSTTVDAIGPDTVTLHGGEVVPCRNVVWTAGVKPPPVVEHLNLPLDNGRIKTAKTLQVEGVDGVWAIGDLAGVPDPARPGKPSPPTAQHAMRQGKLAAQNVAASIGRGTVKPFTYKTLGVFVDMGRGQAVAETLKIRWRGAPAWWLARTYHLAMMPGVKRRLRLLVDWNVELLFGRDTSELGSLGHPGQLESPEPS